MAIRIHRLKKSFTSGELSPLLDARVDFNRYQNGCKSMKNAIALSQGPAMRRSGFKYLYSLSSLSLDHSNPKIKMIPFVFNEIQSYVLIIYQHTNGHPRIVIFYKDGSIIKTNSGDVFYIELDSSYDIDKIDYAQSSDELYITNPHYKPQVIKRVDHNDWTLNDIVFSDMPSEWSDANGWPEKITFHQQRLVFAANKTYRLTVWMSKANSFFDFGTSSPSLASDSITFALNSGDQNKIMWITSSQHLNIGTMSSEWTVQGSNYGPITPTTILAMRQTNNGSERIRPNVVGETTLYVERFGRNINEFRYEFNSNSYVSDDISILAPHLTEFNPIKNWTYQQVPHRLVWSVRDDGKLICLTYRRQHKVVGFSLHETNGKFASVASIPGETREDDLWAVIQRSVNSDTEFYIERLADWFSGKSTKDGRFLDCYSYVKETTEFNQITGLDYLEGNTVSVLLDGSVHPNVKVVNGTIDLNRTGYEAVIGLPYDTEIRPTLPDIQGDSGTSLGRTQRITNLDVLLYETVGLIIKRYDDEGDEVEEEELPFRYPYDPTGEPIPLYSGIKHISFPEGFDRMADFSLIQRDPLPLTVLGIVDTISVYE
jgi:hypothetical protein